MKYTERYKLQIITIILIISILVDLSFIDYTNLLSSPNPAPYIKPIPYFQQDFIISSVCKNGVNIYFEILASPNNTVKFPMNRTGYYINDVPISIETNWNESKGTCINISFLSPGESCYGIIKCKDCKVGDKFMVRHNWGKDKKRTIFNCTGYD